MGHLDLKPENPDTRNALSKIPNLKMDIQKRPRSLKSESSIDSDLLQEIPNQNRPSIDKVDDLSVKTSQSRLQNKFAEQKAAVLNNSIRDKFPGNSTAAGRSNFGLKKTSVDVGSH